MRWNVDRLLLNACLISALALLASSNAYAQGAAIRFIVPFPAGGAHDSLARLVAPSVSEQLNQTIVVENKPGASGVIGLEYVSRMPPDGLTVLVGASSLMGSVPAANIALNNDPRVAGLVKGLVPVSLLGKVGTILCIHPSVPAKTLKEFVAYAKANPNKLLYGSAGIGGTGHLSMELFQQKAGIKMTFVPYKGQPPAAQDLIAGHIQVMLLNYETARPMLEAGRVRALAIASPARHPDYPGLPTIAENGFPGFQTDLWTALFVPPAASPAVVNRLHSAVKAAMADPKLQERIKGIWYQPSVSTPDELAELVRSDIEKWIPVAAAAAAAPQAGGKAQ
ncbi:MAG: Bug family tripartite tricarboxylate transporter substrate binding protein [Burkholderiaceae bacterium]